MGNNLRQRVTERTSGSNGNGGQLEQRDQNQTLAAEIRRMQPEFKAAMPSGGEAAQIIRDALTELRRTPKLAKCESTSVLGALMTCAQLNLRVGVLGQAWPVPFWDKRAKWIDEYGKERRGRYKAQLIVGYRGYRELAWRSGFVLSNDGREVRKGDLFDYGFGLQQRLDHIPSEAGDRMERDVTHFYAITRYRGGGLDYDVWSQAAVNYHRDRFASTRDQEGVIFGPWIEHPVPMGIKTAYLVVVKRGPLSSELSTAIAADGTVRLDLTPDDPDVALHGETPLIEGELVDDAASAEQSGRIAEPQENQLRSLLGVAQLGDKTERDLLAKLAGRQIGAIADLTASETELVITRIIDLKEQADKAGVSLAEHVAELLDRPAEATGGDR